MMKCKECVNLQGEWCELVVDSPCEDFERNCKYFKQKTNADHIRSMSDEELAEFLVDVNAQGCVCPARDCQTTCINCITKWLAEPYKENTDE